MIQQGRGLIQRAGEDEGLVHALARRLAALRVGRGVDAVLNFLDQDLVFVPFDIHVADRISGEGAFSDVALGFARNADIGGSRHDVSLVVVVHGHCGRILPEGSATGD